MRCFDAWRLSVFSLIGLALSACGQLPQPFRNDGSDTAVYRLLAPGADAALRIEPPAGLPAEVSEELAKQIAAKLTEMEIPASSRLSEQNAHRVEGIGSRMGGRMVFAWRILSPSREAIEEFTDAYDPRVLDSPAGLSALAKDVATKIADLTTDLRRKTVPLAAPKLSIGPITGAPGDGATALAAAIRQSLARNQIAVAEDLGPDHHVIVCDVNLVDAPRNGQIVSISWRMMRPDGSEVGAVTQQNMVPKGSLDRRWGRVAEAAADGGAEGIVLMLQELQRNGQ